MRLRRFAVVALVAAGSSILLTAGLTAQAPSRGATPAAARGAAATPARGAAGSPTYATLAQLMRGTLFPSSNIVFDVQDNNPATKKPDFNGPFIGNYQSWEGVENAGLALAESASLVLLPGRKCSNGQPVPLQQADFVQAAQALRTMGMTIYTAAKTKNQNAVADLSDKLAETCANCHDKYRPDSRIGGPKVGAEKRCLPGV